MTKPRLNMDSIAKGLGAERRGRVVAKAGYFGAMELVADFEARLRSPAGGGRRTDPRWTERRLLPLAEGTLKRLEALAEKMRSDRGITIEPMQLAALILERTTERVSMEETDELLAQRATAKGTANRKRKGSSHGD